MANLPLTGQPVWVSRIKPSLTYSPKVKKTQKSHPALEGPTDGWVYQPEHDPVHLAATKKNVSLTKITNTSGIVLAVRVMGKKERKG